MKSRRESSVTPESHAGVVFPLTEGERATQPVGRRVISAATARVDTAASEAARDEVQWYAHYVKHFHELTRLSAGVNSSLIATDGLACLHDTMRFRRQGAESSIAEAISWPRANYFTGITVGGSVPLATSGLVLIDDVRPARGDDLLRLLERWDDHHIAEPSATAALRMVHEHPEWLDLSDTTVVVLGAAAEMGPLEALLSWGAHVIAVDLPGRATWRALIDVARRSPGRLTVPVPRTWAHTGQRQRVGVGCGCRCHHRSSRDR